MGAISTDTTGWRSGARSQWRSLSRGELRRAPYTFSPCLWHLSAPLADFNPVRPAALRCTARLHIPDRIPPPWSNAPHRPPFSLIYFSCFAILGGLILLTLFIGVVTTSMDQAQSEALEALDVEKRFVALGPKHNMDNENLNLYRTVFTTLDLDGGGTIDEDELKIGLTVRPQRSPCASARCIGRGRRLQNYVLQAPSPPRLVAYAFESTRSVHMWSRSNHGRVLPFVLTHSTRRQLCSRSVLR